MPTKNKLSDLHNTLFEQLERLNDESLSQEELDKEIDRTNAMVKIGRIIVDNAQVALDAQKYVNDYDIKKKNDMLQITAGE